jgi:hypothetical protein
LKRQNLQIEHQGQVILETGGAPRGCSMAGS